ncbi:MAG: TadE/TadG family type IV pilus assembly protein [Planctomycetaceae bacterium]
MNKLSLRKLLKRVHRDERGVVSLETVLIIGAIALPILIILIKFGWPIIWKYFKKGTSDLQGETDRAIQNQ